MLNLRQKNLFLRILLCGLIVQLFLGTLFQANAARRHNSKNIKTRYQLVFETNLPKKMLDFVKEQSVLLQKIKTPPDSALALTRRVKRDVLAFQKVLKSYGYMDAQIEPVIEDASFPHKIRIKIREGIRYSLQEIQFFSEHGPYIPPAKISQMQKGNFFETSKIRKLEEKIIVYAQNNGYPFSEFKKHQLTYDKEKKIIHVNIYIHLNELMRFGIVTIDGNKRTKNNYILNRLSWKQGDLFSQELLDESRKNIIKSDIFDGITMKPLREEAKNGIVPIHIQLVENKRHFVGAGLDASSEEGFGGKLFWGHRNLFNKGENLKLQYERQRFKRGFEATYKMPDIFLQNQYLAQSLEVKKQNTDAYQSTERHYKIAFEHHFSKIYNKNNGMEFSFEKVDDKNFRIISFPQFFAIDSTRNLLDPKNGKRISLLLQPDFVFGKKNHPFFTVEFEASKYISLDKNSTHILALRTKLGTIISSSFDALPKTRLFYAGGANSVRGYGYQKIGPLSSDARPKDRGPLGGRSLWEGSMEWRYRFLDSFGIVPFVDFGALSQNKFIKFKNLLSKKNDTKKNDAKMDDSRLFWGAGIGGRYYLGDIGPVRADIALPLNRRKGIDRFMQFYASFGQSF